MRKKYKEIVSSDYCDGDEPWYQLKNKEFRSAADSSGCSGGSLVLIETVFTEDLLSIYPVSGKVCVREITFPVWEVAKKNERKMPLFDEMSFILVNSFD